MLRSATTPNRTECNQVHNETQHNPMPPTNAHGAGRRRCRFTRSPKKRPQTPSAFACLGSSRCVGFGSIIVGCHGKTA